MSLLQNKNVLLIAPFFYDYHRVIAEGLRQCGASVDYYSETSCGIAPRLFRSLSQRLLHKYQAHYLKELLRRTANCRYDFIFVVRAYLMSVEFVRELKQSHKEATIVLYAWDSLRNNDCSELIGEFDRAFSFDKVDCAAFPQLRYLPSFFTERDEARGAEHTKTEPDIDILFVGCLYKDRYEILKRVKTSAEEQGLTVFSYLYTPLGRYVKGLIADGRYDPRRVKFRTLPSSALAQLIRRSRCILDIEHPNQRGLTMRVFDALSAGKKLITTNTSITEEDFYDPEAIRILERVRCAIDAEFVRGTPRAVAGIEQYSLKNWLRQIFAE